MSDGACIEDFKRCNDYRDCSDNSDEFDCPEIIYDDTFGEAGKMSQISLLIHILKLEKSVIGPIYFQISAFIIVNLYKFIFARFRCRHK